MGSYPYDELTHRELYEHLTVIDAKCAVLFQMSSIILTIGTVLVATGKIPHGFAVFVGVIFGLFLLVSMMSLGIIWLVWSKSETRLRKLVRRRTRIYNFSVALTALGLLLIGIFTFCAIRVAV